jgi:hypothetical protein
MGIVLSNLSPLLAGGCNDGCSAGCRPPFRGGHAVSATRMLFESRGPAPGGGFC